MLTVAGLHTPEIPSLDMVCKVGTVPPVHIVSDVPKLNVGEMFGITYTSTIVEAAHLPGSGLNVYTAEVVLLTVEGLHVPVIPSIDVVGNTGAALPSQIL